MTVPNPLLTFTESEFTKGVFRAETKFGEVSYSWCRGQRFPYL